MRSLSVLLITFLLLAGCASVSQQEDASTGMRSGEPAVSQQDEIDSSQTATPAPSTRFTQTPTFVDGPVVKRDDAEDVIRGRLSDATVGVNFHDIPVGVFINEVFGNILGLSFELDDALKNRDDLVTVRADGDQSHYKLYRLAREVLLNYGVGIEVLDTHIRFIPADDEKSTEPPLFITGMTLPDVPQSHRTVFQFVPLRAVRENILLGWLETAYANTGLKTTADSLNNAVVLQGPADVVRRAKETIELLDRPNMRSQFSMRISPSFVQAPALAKSLTDILISEGIGASQSPPFGAVIVLPISSVNSVIVFAADQKILDHVKRWAEELDRPPGEGAGGTYFYYQVRNTSASDLANALRGGGKRDDGGENVSGGFSLPAGILVDKNRNGLIFTGAAENWNSILPIVKFMDRPARLVNVEVTVASVTLSDDRDLGVEWLFNDTHGDFSGVGRSTVGLGGNGFSYTLNNSGQVRFALNALAQDQRATILSKPSITVKSGDSASIDVGQEVPIITSQSQSTDAVDAPVLQSIEYRKTGVLLKVEPVVHSGNQVDLGLSQEVSEVLDSVSATGSPSIFNRKIETSLTLRDGGAVILGGLISNSSSQGETKIPVLGNIPGFGALFRSSGNQESRSELILVIQAYIIDLEENSWDFNEQLRNRLELLDEEYLDLE